MGTRATCNVLGFLSQLGFGPPLYNTCLSFYFLLTIRYGMPKEKFATRYEAWMHLFCWSFILSTATVGLVLEVYDEMEITQGCWIKEYPQGCAETETTCISLYMAYVYACLLYTSPSPRD